ncbi:thiol:disulfide interchange protein DsbA/DsbL [Cupriavidus basilensis]|uniref:Thiol:disulfide interchange protein n=1 Tax=Cupriavidus basilensis TaxID=68895 RepID=A0ABT6ATD7_9BURK|nr:thiol:disulfide interchange protein DsbA/DsbL [Cupriavidus basilensis]MDF3835890.1 thiol:disulfide interchange protein DsbA/DsbL [Cupriavidus basilensis]
MKKFLGCVLISLGFLAGTASASPAAPLAGSDYLVLPQAQPTSAGPGKIEVTEFFWYACPHCYALEPALQAWAMKQSKDVVFKRVAVAFQDRFEPHTRMFYALTALGKEAEMTPKVFKAIHVDHNYLLTAQAQADFLAQFGIDRKAYLDAYNGFAAQSNTRNADKTWRDYKIDGTPTIAIQGKYLVAPATSAESMQKAGTPATNEQQLFDATLKTADSIINGIRARRL